MFCRSIITLQDNCVVDRMILLDPKIIIWIALYYWTDAKSIIFNVFATAGCDGLTARRWHIDVTSHGGTWSQSINFILPRK